LGFKHRKIVKVVDLISPRFEKETAEGKPKSNTKIYMSLTLPSPISKDLLNSELSVEICRQEGHEMFLFSCDCSGINDKNWVLSTLEYFF